MIRAMSRDFAFAALPAVHAHADGTVRAGAAKKALTITTT
jgi:hypothetical protein